MYNDTTNNRVIKVSDNMDLTGISGLNKQPKVIITLDNK